jgi:hypothetical protein
LSGPQKNFFMYWYTAKINKAPRAKNKNKSEIPVIINYSLI